jgi:hypothetical protein
MDPKLPGNLLSPASEKIALRARAAREAAGLLTSHAIGEDGQDDKIN